jgi:adenine deaminase
MESPGAVIGPKDIAEAMQWQGIIGLGEMMNFPGVYNGIKNVHDEMGETLSKGKIIGGHYASPDLGIPFHGYVAGGPEDDHEGTSLEDAVARVRQGMKVMLRQGSAWHDVSEGVRAITELGLDSRHFILCTDDSHSQTLVSDGHVNRAVNVAIENGIDPITAIQMATINTADHFMLSREIGVIAPRRYADILCVKNLTRIHPEVVFAKGRMIAKEGNILIDIPSYNYPEWAVGSIHINRKIGSDDFVIKVPENKKGLTNKESILVNVIGVIENQAPTKHIKMEVPVIDGKISANLKLDLAKVSVIERHHGTGSIQIGLVHGFGFKGSCAVASTIAHDSHNLIVVGTGDNEMAKAVEELVKMGGGQIVIKDGEVAGRVNLPIAGLMSSENAKEVAIKAGSVLRGFKDCGCNLNNPNMQLSLLALVVIPELRLSDKGLVDVNHFKIISLFD